MSVRDRGRENKKEGISIECSGSIGTYVSCGRNGVRGSQVLPEEGYWDVIAALMNF